MSMGAGMLLALSMLAVPLVGWIVSRLIVRGAPAFTKLAGDHALAPWHGTYYAFDDHQVRVIEEDGRLYFVAKDVVRAVGWPRLPRGFATTQGHRVHHLAESGLATLDLEGLEALLGRRREAACGRFLRWARNEVCAPHARKRAG